VTPEVVGMMERLAGAAKNLAATSPATLKLGIRPHGRSRWPVDVCAWCTLRQLKLTG
jgi:hypothetical protein